jgi:ferredoxin
MTLSDKLSQEKAVIDRDGLGSLIAALRQAGYQVIGPQAVDGAITYEPVEDVGQLPAGWFDEQDGGSYRLVKGDGDALFGHTVGPHTWKRYLFPPSHRLWSGQRGEAGFSITPEPAPSAPYAFLGVRACELKAIAIQDKVFGYGADKLGGTPNGGPDGAPNGTRGLSGGHDVTFTDSGYALRRQAAFIVAVNCGRAGKTCFCVSMDAGPKATSGFDLSLTELTGSGGHSFVVEVGSERGAAVLAGLPKRPASTEDVAAAAAVVARTADAMGREMVAEVGPLMKRNLGNKRWDEVATRCLGCANCTMVCPTCFCSTVEDTTDLTGMHAERWRKWDSCFTLDFTYIHGGSIRREARSRYRQWITHKLSNWYDQFGSSGCTGCGRCITWCPVGIDITEEARAIRDSEGTL